MILNNLLCSIINMIGYYNSNFMKFVINNIKSLSLLSKYLFKPGVILSNDWQFSKQKLHPYRYSLKSNETVSAYQPYLESDLGRRINYERLHVS